jgi:metallo-beta-lactamase family protein
LGDLRGPVLGDASQHIDSVVARISLVQINYLKAMLGDARNDVLFVGYQAATPGRDILTHGPRGGWVGLDGRRYAIRAQIHQFGGHSAHAGQADLLRFVTGIPQMPVEIRIVHGDDAAKAALKLKLEEAGAGKVQVPGAPGV